MERQFSTRLFPFFFKFKDTHVIVQLIEHLKSYYTVWANSLNAKHTRISTYNARKSIDNLIRNPARLTHAPPVPQYPTSNRPLPTAGLIGEGATIEEQETRTNSRIQLAGASQPFVGVQKRPAEPMGVDGDERKVSGKRAHRQCAKCGQGEGCVGNRGKARCRNPCRDCKSTECDGRDSRNRTRKCPNS